MRAFKVLLFFVILMITGVDSFTQNTITNKGKEFWVGYGHHQYMESDNSQNMVLYLSNTENQVATVTVTLDSAGAIPANGFKSWSRTYKVLPNQVISTGTTQAVDWFPKTTCNTGIGPMPKKDVAGCNAYDSRLYDGTNACPGPLCMGGEGVFKRKAFRIVSDVPIVAYAHIYSSYSSGATMLLPIDAWGFTYTTINSEQVNAGGPGYSWFYVIAKEDKTRIRITPSQNSKFGRVADTPFEVDLQKGQIYQIIAPSDNEGNGPQFTGSTIQSIPGPDGICHKIAAFAGSSRTRGESVPCGTSSGRDNDMQQIFPQHAWGKRYLTAPSSTSNGSSNLKPAVFQTNVYKIVVKDPSTVVKRNGTVLTKTGSYYQFSSNTADYIEADKPIMVAQFMSGGSGCNSGDGDPEMVYLSPIEQAIKKIAFYRNDQTAIYSNFLTMVIPTGGLASLKIDGVPFANIPASLKHSYPHPNKSGYTVVVRGWPAAQAQSTAESDSAFVATTYGLGNAESYAFNAGTNLENLSALSSIRNISDTTAAVDEHKFTCDKTPLKLSALIAYQPTKITWQLSKVSGLSPNTDVVMNAPTPAATVLVGSATYYKYTLPGNYQFNSAGDYYIPIVMESPNTDVCSSVDSAKILVSVHAKPVADFSITQTGCPTDSVQLSGSTTSGTEYTLNQWKWLLMPGVTDSVQNVKYLFPGTGDYFVKLTVISKEGCVGDTVKKVTLTGTPAPSYTVNPKKICLGDSITITPGAAATTEWYWDYGNGKKDTLYNNNPFKIKYDSFGVFVIRQSIKLPGTCNSGSRNDTITVYAKPNIGFIYPKGCLPANGIVQFQDTSYVPDSTRQTINSWLWNFGDKNATPANPNTATIKNPSHIYGYGSDTLSLKVTTDKGCWRDSVWVDTFKISPVVALQPVDSVCYGIAPFSIATKASVTNAVPGTGYFKGNGIDSAGLFNTVTAGVGAHTIWYVFTSNTGCKDSVSRIIKVNALPKVNFGFPDTCLAPNGFVQFSDSSTIGNSETISKYSWNFGDVNATGSNPNTSTQKNASHYFIQEGTYAVKLSDTTAFGCYSDTTINIAVKIKPALTFASLAALCENATAITLTDSVKVTNGLTGTNAFTGTGITGSTFNPAIAGAGNNQPIKYVFTTTGGCSDSLSRTITVHAKPKSSFSAPDSCLSPNGYVQFTHSSTIGNSETISKYSWNFGDVNATGSNPNTSTQKNASHYFIKEGTYAVKLSDTTAFGCYSDTTINVAVKIKPALTFASLAALCENATAITLTDSVKVTNGLTGTGSFTGTGITGSGFNPATATAGTYNLTYSYTTTGGCTANISKPITVKAVPNPAFTYPSGCLSTSGLVQFTNTTVPASGTTIQGYTWNFGDATNIGPGNPNTSTAVSPSHNYVQGTYTIKLTAAYTNGCSNEKTETVTFNTTPLLAAPAIVPGICDNTGTTLTLNGPAVTNAVPGTGVFSGTGITNGTAGTFDAAVAGTGTHNITYTYTSTANSNCKATATIPVKVFAKPTASFTVNPTAVCLDAKPTFTNTSTIASPYKIAKWEWDFGDAQTQQSTTAPVPFTHTYAAAGSYAVTLKLTSDSGCVVSSAPQNVKVNPLPVIDSMGIPAVICMPSGRAQFTGKGSISDNTALNYAWTFGDGGTSSAKDPLYVYASSGSGSYNATLTVTSTVTGCKQTMTKTVNGFSTQPTAKFSTAVDLCQGTPSVFNNQSTAGSAPVNQYIWDFGDGSGAPPTSTKNPEKTYSSPGTYNVSLIVRDDKGCESNPAYKMDVTVHLQPKVDAGPNLVLKQGEYGQFKPKVNDSVSVTLTWSAQAGLPSGIVDPSVLSAWVRGIANDTWYYLTGVGDYSCSAKDSVLVKVLKTIRIPNSFSPNGDGINDRWLIEGLVDYPGHSVEVFNRQGVRVYSSFRYQTPWDGTYNTKALPAGTYYYIIDPKNGIPAMTGWVLISK